MWFCSFDSKVIEHEDKPTEIILNSGEKNAVEIQFSLTPEGKAITRYTLQDVRPKALVRRLIPQVSQGWL